MMRYIKQITFALVILLLIGGVAQAQIILYGAANGLNGGIGPSTFYRINQNTGAVTPLGPIGFNNVTGMAFLNDGRLVASVNGDDICGNDVCSYLIEIEPFTGQGVLIGQMGNFTDSCGRFPDITYNPTTNTLYAYGDFCSGAPEGLFTVNTTTGVATSVGATGYTGGGNGLARDPNTGTLYATPFDNNSLVIIDPNTGSGADVPGSPGNVPNRVNALDFDPNTGTLYGSYNEGSGSFLVVIDLLDGTTTTIGETATGLDAIVFGEKATLDVPTLSEWGLIAMAGILGLVGFMVIRRRATA